MKWINRYKTNDPFTVVTVKGYEIAKNNVKNYDYHKCFWRAKNDIE